MRPVFDVRLVTREYASGTYDMVQVTACDIRLTAHITGERTVALAQRLADESGLQLHDMRRTDR